MVSVTHDSVRERINVSAAEAPDDVVSRFITAAGVTVQVETGKTVDPSNCSAAEAEAIRNLANILRLQNHGRLSSGPKLPCW